MKKMLIYTVFVLFAGTISFSCFAINMQDKIPRPLSIQISGQVISFEDKMPISGASIHGLNNPKRVVYSDETGHFALTLSETETFLVVNAMGFESQKLAITDKATILVSLKTAENVLNQVVVTALGVRKTGKSISYAITELKGSEFNKAKETNIANALVGKIAGVNVSSTATGPNGSSRVIIRGNGSLNGNNQPMYVVNDLPIDNTQLNLPGIGNGPDSSRINVDRGDGTSVINPDDIKSITVLKGGTAAAIYGASAANGVILIQTKRGAAQKGIGIDYATSFSVETPAVYPHWQYEYGSGHEGKKPQNQSEAIADGRWSWGAKMDESEVVQFDGVKRAYSPQKNNIKNFYKPGSTYINSIALSGGSEKANARLSFSNTQTESIVPQSDFNRKTIQLAANLNLTPWLKMDVVTQYNLEKSNNRPTVSDAESNPNWGVYMIANTVDIRNLAPGYNENGVEVAWNPVPIATNPQFVVNKIKNNDTKNRFLGMVNIKINLNPNWFWQGRIGQDYTLFDFFGYIPKTTLNNPIGNVQYSKMSLSTSNAEVLLNYNKKNLVNQLSLNMLVGANSRTSLRDEIRVDGGGFVLDNFYSLTNLTSLNYSYPYGKTKTNAIYAALDLDYKKTLFLNLTGRQDWFSTLSPKNNTVFYPSIGTSWIISETLNCPEWISFAKLRSSWAQVGGATPNPYALNSSYSLTTGGHLGQQLQGTTGSRVPNPSLRPLTSTTFEIGTDIGLFNNRLVLDWAWYHRATTNDIVETTISEASGARSALLNIGKMTNKGIELLLSAKLISTMDFSWESSLNGSYNRNRVEALTDQLSSITMATSVNSYAVITSDLGRPYSIIKGYKPLKDGNGNTVYNVNGTTASLARGPLEELGQGVHPWGMGFNNEFRYKNFSFQFLIDGKFGGSLYSGTDLYGTRMGLTQLTLQGRENGLPIKGVDTNGNPIDMVIAPANLRTYYDGLRNISSTFIYDASFIKLRQIVMGYRLPLAKSKLFSKFQEASIGLVARNLFILYKKTPNVDPESVFSAGNAQGVEQFGVPKTRSIGFSLNLKL